MTFRVLDLFCCEGGAAMGYHLAGATEIVGFDLKAQPRYPFTFVNRNAAGLTAEFIRTFDFVHASPPCQFVSELTPKDKRSNHLNLIPTTRAMLRRAGVPYVIENVRRAKAHLIDPVSLFGTMFGNRCTDSQGRTFVLSRERCFETSWGLTAPADPGACGQPIANVYGGHFRVRGGEFRTGKGTGRTVDLPGEDRQALARELMGMPWATMQGMSEAVPPSFTRYIGEQFLACRASTQEAAA